MSDNTKIEWTDATWNPVRGCSLVSDGCRNCYAMHVAARFNGSGMPYEGLTMKTTQGPKWTGEVKLVPEVLDQPAKWHRPRKIFVNSMSDLFHPSVPDAYIDKIVATMALSQQHVFQILTKRPERMREYSKALSALEIDDERYQSIFDVANVMDGRDRETAMRWPLSNVWLGVSVENQATADDRIPALLQTPAAIRWLSMEPLLGPIDLTRLHNAGPLHARSAFINCLRGGTWGAVPNTGELSRITHNPLDRIDWVIVGGESGPGARPMHPEWVRSLRDQCAAERVPFLFKQWGEWAPKHVMPKDTMLPMRKYGWININGGEMEPGHVLVFKNEYDHHELLGRIGKKAAGRQLDGRTWDEYPEVKL